MLILVVGLPDRLYKSDQFKAGSLWKDVFYFGILSILIILLLFSFTLAQYLRRRAETDALTFDNLAQSHQHQHLNVSSLNDIHIQDDSMICTCNASAGRLDTICQNARNPPRLDRWLEYEPKQLRSSKQSDEISPSHGMTLAGGVNCLPELLTINHLCKTRPPMLSHQQHRSSTRPTSNKLHLKNIPLVHKAFFERVPSSAATAVRPPTDIGHSRSNDEIQLESLDDSKANLYDIGTSKRLDLNQSHSNQPIFEDGTDSESSSSVGFNPVKSSHYNSYEANDDRHSGLERSSRCHRRCCFELRSQLSRSSGQPYFSPWALTHRSSLSHGDCLSQRYKSTYAMNPVQFLRWGL